jgi:hypothetical protein
MNDLVLELDREVITLVDTLHEHPVARTLFDGTITAGHYAHYLEQTEHYVGVSDELLRGSGERLLATRKHASLAHLLLQKSEEEAGHDAWARDDRRAIGFADADTGPGLAVQAYIFTHRFEMKKGSGAAFLGTAYVLEALSARLAPIAVQNLLAKSRIPGIEGAVTFLRAHGEADQDHIAHLATVLRVFTDPAEIEAIVRSAKNTARFFPEFFS